MAIGLNFGWLVEGIELFGVGLGWFGLGLVGSVWFGLEGLEGLEVL